MQCNRVLDKLNAVNMYKIDELTAMRYLTAIWTTLSPNIIRIWWITYGLITIQGTSDDEAGSIEDAEVTSEFVDVLSQFLFISKCISTCAP